jgi:hypothetical protein
MRKTFENEKKKRQWSTIRNPDSFRVVGNLTLFY